MKKLLFCLLIISSAIIVQGQHLHLNLFAGVSNYQGDLQPKRFTFSQAHPAFGVGVLYEISEQFFIRAGLTYGKVSGDDSKAALNRDRNLNFTSSIIDLHLGLEYDIVNLYEHSITPYIFAGVAGYHFNPYTIDTKNQKVFLQPLGTEGQGFYLGRKKYPLTQMAIPIGGGIKLALNDDVRVKFEVGLRKLFTDYLDDVSNTFADRDQLLLNNGQQAVDLAFRGNEVKPILVYPAEGAKRGNAKSKDWYYFTGISVSFRLQPNNGNNHKGKSNTGCPVGVY